MKLLSEDILRIEDELYFFAKEINLLYKINTQNGKYTFLGMIPEKNIFAQRLVSKIVCWGEKLYLIPLVSGDIWIYSLSDKSWERIEVKNYENNWADSFFRNAVVYKQKLYLFGGYYPAVVILDLQTNEMTYFREPFLNRNDKKCFDLFFRGEPVLIDNCIFLASCIDNTLFKFNLENLEYSWIEVGNKENKYSGVVWDGHYFWMAPRHNTSIVRWDGIEKAVEYEVNYASHISKISYIGIADVGNSFIIPGLGGSLIFQKNGEIQRKKSGYTICKSVDNEILLQFNDGTINIIDSMGKIKEYNFFIDNRKFVETIKMINYNKAVEMPKKIFEGESFPLELWLAMI